MKTNYYRVECNFGNKFFENGFQAFKYFERMRKRGFKVSLWLVVFNDNLKDLAVRQELIAHS